MDSTLRTTNARTVSGARISWTIAGLLALTHLALAITAAFNESPTFDEPTHLTAGYSYWVKHDYRFDQENGNLPARWASCPSCLPIFAFQLNPAPPGNSRPLA